MMSLLRKEIIQELQKLCARHSVDAFYLFGSRANGMASSESDYDFLVRFSPQIELRDYGQNFFDLLESLKSLLGSPVDLVTENTIKNPVLLEEINKEKQLIYEAKPQTSSLELTDDFYVI